ncbi:MAG: hypothetical protein JWL77_2866 [Chthonomonadaceae bacterium]|nr:hypothetical protein [Chthonomonadaceae bacterium]
MNRKHILSPLLVLILALPALADVPNEGGRDRLPEGSGLAAKDPGDHGIEKDATVLFHEDFEADGLGAWGEKKGPVVLTAKAPHSGKQCVEISMHRGQDTGGHLIKWFTPGADTVYVRFYVKFSKDYQYDHHFVTLLANPPATAGEPSAKPE